MDCKIKKKAKGADVSKIIEEVNAQIDELGEAVKKFAEQRLQVSGIEHRIVNCSEDMSEAEKLNLTETPTIVDPDGTMFVGATAAADWMKYHNTKQ